MTKIFVHQSSRQHYPHNQKVKTIDVSINRWIDKQNMVQTFHGMLFSLKKEENTDTHSNMNEPKRHYAQWNIQGTKGQYCMISPISGI